MCDFNMNDTHVYKVFKFYNAIMISYFQYWILSGLINLWLAAKTEIMLYADDSGKQIELSEWKENY